MFFNLKELINITLQPLKKTIVDRSQNMTPTCNREQPRIPIGFHSPL